MTTLKNRKFLSRFRNLKINFDIFSIIFSSINFFIFVNNSLKPRLVTVSTLVQRIRTSVIVSPQSERTLLLHLTHRKRSRELRLEPDLVGVLALGDVIRLLLLPAALALLALVADGGHFGAPHELGVPPEVAAPAAEVAHLADKLRRSVLEITWFEKSKRSETEHRITIIIIYFF